MRACSHDPHLVPKAAEDGKTFNKKHLTKALARHEATKGDDDDADEDSDEAPLAKAKAAAKAKGKGVAKAAAKGKAVAKPAAKIKAVAKPVAKSSGPGKGATAKDKAAAAYKAAYDAKMAKDISLGVDKLRAMEHAQRAGQKARAAAMA